MTMLLTSILPLEGAMAADAFNSDSCRQVRSSTAAITVAFNYGATPRNFMGRLENTNNDGRFFHESIAKNFAPTKNSLLSDGDVKNGKAEFLQILQQKAGQAEFVNLNYSGHGIRQVNGEWALPLPNMPRDLADRCISGTDEKGLNIRSVPAPAKITQGSAKQSVDLNCTEALRQYIVTPAEIQHALRGKKIIALIDACYSGAAEFKDGIVISASAGDQTASDSNTGSLPNGTLTNEVRKLLDGCTKTDSPDRITLSDLMKNFTEVKPNDQGVRAAVMSRHLRKIGQVGGQHLGIVRSGPKLWEHCLEFAKIPTPRRENCTQPTENGTENPLLAPLPTAPFRTQPPPKSQSSESVR